MVTVQDQAGRTPLQCAAYGGYITCMAVLMENNADPNIQDKEVKSYRNASARRPLLRFRTGNLVWSAHRGGPPSTGLVTMATWTPSNCCWATMRSPITWSTQKRGEEPADKGKAEVKVEVGK